MFTERKIAAFQHKIADLPDTPTLTASELKARFDACPEQLRQALNAVCDDGKALENRIDAYRAQTFTGEITRDMLSPVVRGELDAKATQTALAAETTAREAAETANASAHTSLQTQISAKCGIVCGTYTGNWSGNTTDSSTQTITLGFQPKALLVASNSMNGSSYSTPMVHLALPDVPSSWITITATGFTATKYMNWNANGKFRYIAFK